MIVLLNRTYKYHYFVFDTELYFCDPKIPIPRIQNSSWKIVFAFWQGTQGDANIWLCLQNVPYLQHSIDVRWSDIWIKTIYRTAP